MRRSQTVQSTRLHPLSCQVKALPKTSKLELEAQLTEAHAELQLIHQDGDVSRWETLVRFGAFEVRLIKPPDTPPTTAVRFWMELFDHDRQLSIDSAGNCVLEEAVIAAEDFIARATRLSENPHSWRRST
jgi:hypothetical protein